jgi:hypothetical protein
MGFNNAATAFWFLEICRNAIEYGYLFKKATLQSLIVPIGLHYP